MARKKAEVAAHAGDAGASGESAAAKKTPKKGRVAKKKGGRKGGKKKGARKSPKKAKK